MQGTARRGGHTRGGGGGKTRRGAGKTHTRGKAQPDGTHTVCNKEVEHGGHIPAVRAHGGKIQ
jgi:hypothetical protein